MEDLISIIYSFSARMYGQRKSKRKTEKIIEELNKEDN
jgi:putative resolvase